MEVKVDFGWENDSVALQNWAATDGVDLAYIQLGELQHANFERYSHGHRQNNTRPKIETEIGGLNFKKTNPVQIGGLPAQSRKGTLT